MPKNQPFTALCQQLRNIANPPRADLHLHSIASDGEFTPSQVVTIAEVNGLRAVALTDHDTIDGVAEAQQSARINQLSVEVIPAVELTTNRDGRELHLLAYFVPLTDPSLNELLAKLCERRRERFWSYFDCLNREGITICRDRAELCAKKSVSLGRRHIAELLIVSGIARSRNEAFHRYINPLRGSVLTKLTPDIADAIELVHSAGGVASLAHPPIDADALFFHKLSDMGLDAIEVEYAWGRNSIGNRFREIAASFNLIPTGGSDCHGAEPITRRIGSYCVEMTIVERLRSRACDHSHKRITCH